MIISHRHRYVFVHIPKTGGTSLTLALERRLGPQDIVLSDTPKGLKRRRRVRGVAARGRLWKHSTLADIEGLVDPAIFSGYLLVTLARNPWARAVSYHRWLRLQSFENPAVALAKALDFRDFLRQPLILSHMAVPVRHYLTDARGQEYPALILRLDDLGPGLAELEAHLGFPPGPLPRSNASGPPGADWRGSHDAETRALIAHAAAEDIARFGWTFDG
ncbi:sulfotransferase family 2 domain-containing protein [Paracoccus sp. (in: a-proteobacteria)]|uniref:sulfotransferase family 2 domain-containing protein n=1 Tax=Paracoccus sp. TaxID=267 RepID=UPI0026E01A56|nr:sulfotransferase family 2 domain-containing protein [Paracoccus sp. (in: a-proteobacteria)]MDO5369614.1 sulfotransferase family 2 domain-containing protein [Paracoccus sp. (in: a-proteobacteria)]